MDVEFVRELEGHRDDQTVCLVKRGDEFFVVSYIPTAFDHDGDETLVFPADKDGEVTSWEDVAGGRGKTREDAIAELAEKGPDPEHAGRSIWDDGKAVGERDLGDVLEAFQRLSKGLARDM